MSVKVFSPLMQDYFEIQGFPQNVTNGITIADPTYTVISGEGITDAVAGIVQKFNVTLYDSGNNRL